jgi:putative NADPH-quinone reductase/1,4-dihydroxy-2-naphthoate octaprenyltransferase
MNVLVINGHPRKNSLSAGFVSAFVSGADHVGINPRIIHVADLEFEPNVTHTTPHLQRLEKDLLQAMELIRWAQHIVFIYPTWWGTMPALLKAFIDRVFISGFAFKEIEGGTGYAPLLRGKTAELITTMDTPAVVYNLFYRAPGHNAMKRAILQFCGFQVTGILSFGPVRYSTRSQREKWVEKVKWQGMKLEGGALPVIKRMKSGIGKWLKAIRLQFYPMSFIAYAAGTFGAQQAGYGFDPIVFWLGYGWLFLLEVSTVLSNDYFDFNSDRSNKYFSPFTGGSRVLVEGLLSFKQMSAGIFLSLTLSFAFLSFVLFKSAGSILTTSVTCGILFVLALGYTVPPLRLSYRGLGEITVGLTHSFFLILCGYLFQGGAVSDGLPWFVSLPLFLAVLPSIILAGIPDFEADKSALKRTLAVRWGKKGAAGIALGFTLVALATTIVFELLDVFPGAFAGILYGIIPHALLLSWLLIKYIKDPSPASRIDSLLVAALTYLMWFAIVPLINLR